MKTKTKQKSQITPKVRRKRRLTVLVLVVLVMVFIWLNSTSLFYSKDGKYKLLAHRGLAQTFDISQVEWDTNTAEIIYEPEHPYLENTIPSMEVAFELGADVVEFDIKLTKDKKLAVFHDFALQYRTDGTGEVSEYTMDELRKLDVGYGYTAVSGQTYPFRGKGVGLMPDIDEVFTAFPDKELLIHVKDGNLETYDILWDKLKDITAERLAQLTIYGDNDGMAYLREQSPDLRLLSMAMLKSALIKYELLGFTGYIPKEMYNMELHIPLKFVRFLWGWPNKFVDRMESVNSRVVIVAGDGKWSEGFDTEESLLTIPKGYTGYVWTNRIDRASKFFRE